MLVCICGSFPKAPLSYFCVNQLLVTSLTVVTPIYQWVPIFVTKTSLTLPVSAGYRSCPMEVITDKSKVLSLSRGHMNTCCNKTNTLSLFTILWPNLSRVTRGTLIGMHEEQMITCVGGEDKRLRHLPLTQADLIYFMVLTVWIFTN